MWTPFLCLLSGRLQYVAWNGSTIAVDILHHRPQAGRTATFRTKLQALPKKRKRGRKGIVLAILCSNPTLTVTNINSL